MIKIRIKKYTECFDLLDRLGADNCVDTSDFEKEDADDEMFRNLVVTDVEELLAELQQQDLSFQDDVKHLDSDSDDLLKDDGPDLEDLQFMDFDQQINLYDKLQAESE